MSSQTDEFITLHSLDVSGPSTSDHTSDSRGREDVEPMMPLYGGASSRPDREPMESQTPTRRSGPAHASSVDMNVEREYETMLREMETLYVRIGQLTEINAQYQENFERVSIVAKKQREENTSLRDSLHAMENQMRTWREEVQHRAEQIENMQEQLSFQGGLEDLEKALAEEKSARHVLQEELSESDEHLRLSREEIRRLRLASTEQDNEIQKLKSEISQMKQEIVYSSNKTIHELNEREQLEDDNRELMKQCGKLQEDIATFRGREEELLSESHSLRRTLDSKVEELSFEIRSLRDQLTCAVSEKTALMMDRERFEFERNRAQDHSERYSKQVQELSQEISNLSAAYEKTISELSMSVEEERKLYLATQEELDNTRHESKIRVREAEADLDRWKRKYSTLETAFDSLRKDFEDMQRKEEGSHSQLVLRLREENGELLRRIDQLQSSLSTSTSQLQQLRSELDILREASSRTEENLSANLHSCSLDKNRMEQKVEDLQMQLIALDGKRETAEKELERLQRENERHRADRNAIESERDFLKRELEKERISSRAIEENYNREKKRNRETEEKQSKAIFDRETKIQQMKDAFLQSFEIFKNEKKKYSEKIMQRRNKHRQERSALVQRISEASAALARFQAHDIEMESENEQLRRRNRQLEQLNADLERKIVRTQYQNSTSHEGMLNIHPPACS